MRLAGLILLALAASQPEPDVPNPGGLWTRLGPPRKGDWRDVFEEEAQTFAAYKASKPVRPTDGRRRIVVLPLLTRPPHDPELLERLVATLEAFYGMPTARLAPAALPLRAYDPKSRQVSVRRLLPHLLARLPDDALFLLGITDRDLNLGKTGFAHGWASFRHRVGVVSTARAESEADPVRRRRRILTLALHEAGHALSVPHCVFYPCLMNGARSMGEADRRPLLLCPVCRAKVCWNLDLAPNARYADLLPVLRRQGLAADARQAEAAAAVTPPRKEG
jgi:archaemetzincin